MAGRLRRQDIDNRLDEAFDELCSRMGGLPSPVEAEGIWTTIWTMIWFEEAHHSTAIEGNTLVLKQVERLLADGRAVGNKELKEYVEVRGYANAAQWVYGQGSSREHGQPVNCSPSLKTVKPTQWRSGVQGSNSDDVYNDLQRLNEVLDVPRVRREHRHGSAAR
jgi:hypothetical protein